MAKAKKAYVCNDCGADFPRWQGQCNACGAWNTISEITVSAKPTSAAARAGGYSVSSGSKVYGINDVESNSEGGARISTGLGELDRTLGGGLTEASVLMITGDPGAGKTTILTQMANYTSKERVVLYNTSEESLTQFSDRAKNRLKLVFDNNNMRLSSTPYLDELIAAIESEKAKIVIQDSIQTITSTDVTGSAGGITQIKYCATELNRYCKTNGITLILIGQVNKDSEMAGPKALEHIVDARIHIEVSESLRTMRPSKNRFGDTDQIGLFKMTEGGLREIKNPSEIFLTGSGKDYSGSAITCIRDGSRNILLEVQTLVSEVTGDRPIRNTIGLNYNRFNMITAILNKCGGIKIYYDIFVNLVGGMKLNDTDTSTDLALAAALISSINDKPLGKKSCFFGELSLTGEVRPVTNGIQRVQEAHKHGFEKIYIPLKNYNKSACEKMESSGITIIKIEHIRDLIQELK